MESQVMVDRFWYREAVPFDLDENGLLHDPSGDLGQVFAANALRLADLRHEPLLILLGEPGIGKTTEVERIFRLEPDSHLVSINLRGYTSQESLHRALVENSAISNWRASNDVLELYLDSFDECLIFNAASCVAAELGELVSSKLRPVVSSQGIIAAESSGGPTSVDASSRANIVERPSIRIRLSCRTGAYVSVIGDEIAAHLKVGKTYPVLKLAPLRREDVCSIAEEHKVNPAAFLEEVKRLHAFPLVSKPHSLKLLLKIFVKDQSLGNGVIDLFELGIRALCEEPSKWRAANRSTKPDVELRTTISRKS